MHALTNVLYMYYSVEARERAACLYSALLVISGPALLASRGLRFVWEWGVCGAIDTCLSRGGLVMAGGWLAW